MKKLPLFMFLCLLLCAGQLPAQMKEGPEMQDYDAVFGLKRERAYPYDVTLIESTAPGNILYPGEQPVFRFLLSNNLNEAIVAEGKMAVLAYGARAIPGNIWLPEVYKVADLPAVSISVNLPPKGSQVIEVKTTLPERFGGYAFIADLGAQGRRFATSCVRTFAAGPERIQFPRTSLDELVGLEAIRRLGIHAVRVECHYVPSDDPSHAEQMKALRAHLQHFQDNNITVLLTIESGVNPRDEPLGEDRPHLDADGVMLSGKRDTVWPPKFDPDFQKFVADLCTDCGWPRGPVTAVQLWNEPWEGVSISGWQADMLRYRAMYTAMAQGVETARQAGAEVLITGCDSSTNTLDKLFGDGKDTYLKWLDAATIHYQGLSSPALWRAWRDRQGPLGRVKIWDTESWVANTDDRIGVVLAGDRAAGYDRNLGIYYGNITTRTSKQVTLPGSAASQPIHTYTTWSTAAAVGAARYFLGERSFHDFLFQNGLPWVMSFDGRNGQPDDGTLVVVGDLGEAFGAEKLPLRGVMGLDDAAARRQLRDQLAALPADAPERAALQKKLATKPVLSGGSLTLENPAGEFTLYDFYGNPADPKEKTITVPLDNRGFFLRTNGAPGSFARLRAAVEKAKISGYEPVDIVAHDLLAPVASKPSLHLTLTNVLNRPVTGELGLTLGKLKLQGPGSITIDAHESKDVMVPVVSGDATPDNTYPLTAKFDAGADGSAEHIEDLHVNQIAARTITVDGKLDDWNGVAPQPVHTSAVNAPSLMEQAWLPFVKFGSEQKSGLGSGYLAYDDKYFYFAAKIAGATPAKGSWRYATRDDDAFFYPDVSYELDPHGLLMHEVQWEAPTVRADAALFLPGSRTVRSHTSWDSVTQAFALDIDLPADARKKVSFYCVDPDFYENGRRRIAVEVQDRASGKVLAKSSLAEYGAGSYLSFVASGKVRVVFHSALSWLSANLSGIFFDPADGSNPQPTGAASATFAGNDLKTGGAWEGVYGAEGYQIFGAPPHLPAYASISPVQTAGKIEHRWPADVPHYTYRHDAELPAGGAPNKFDNVLIAFNVIPEDQKPAMFGTLPGVMPGFIAYQDTDYEYALNPVATEHGGGTEIWRMEVPGMVRKNFYPREPASAFDGPVKDGQLAFSHDGNTRVVEAAIPWSEIPLVRKAFDEGRTVKFSFRVNDAAGPGMELAQERSVSKSNPFAFHPDWVEHWANELEFSFEKPPSK